MLGAPEASALELPPNSSDRIGRLRHSRSPHASPKNHETTKDKYRLKWINTRSRAKYVII